MSIVTFDHPALSLKAQTVAPAHDVSDLIATMRTALKESVTGVGLAAPQVNELLRVVIVRKTVMINPEIVWRTNGSETKQEGCLSYPLVFVDVKRPKGITVSYEDERRQSKRKILSGFEARIACHEIEHLDGVCLVGDEWRRKSKETKRLP